MACICHYNEDKEEIRKMMIPEKYEVFYPNVYTPEEQAAIDRLLRGSGAALPAVPVARP